MFGCELISDWQVGSPVYWKAKTEDGTEVIYVEGEILEYIEGRKITMTTFDPNSETKDNADELVRLTYDLSDTSEGVKLTITQGDYAKVEQGQKRYEESRSAWQNMVIPAIEQLLNE